MDFTERFTTHKFMHIINAQNKYDAYMEKYNKLKNGKNDLCTESVIHFENTKNFEEDILQDNIPDEISDNSPAFEEEHSEMKTDDPRESDVDITGSVSTVSFLKNFRIMGRFATVKRNLSRMQYNVLNKTPREKYPVPVVNMNRIVRKEQKPTKKDCVKVIQKGNFFEIISDIPRRKFKNQNRQI
ncbi:hypothetical protein CEXT_788581 [Caerostris extrusa]|uniref:Uncharacterized protein n=1 Tax=Caerostris extrusa TaxID=172846 RepID=A0AAV4NRL7_CAEEX|nr:hypothetical protein CEXT_788581 [Caerostris extrusa]